MYASPWEAALSALEWWKITARLSAHASSEPGRDLCAALSPGTDLDAIRASLEENRDGRRMLLQDGALPLDEVKEIREEVGKAAKGASLSPTELLRIGKTARVGERVRRFFEDRRGKYPRLAPTRTGSRRCATSPRRSSRRSTPTGTCWTGRRRNWDPCGGSS